jgi:hypothetical protein
MVKMSGAKLRCVRCLGLCYFLCVLQIDWLGNTVERREHEAKGGDQAFLRVVLCSRIFLLCLQIWFGYFILFV